MRGALLLIAGLLVSSAAQALEYRSLTDNAIVYDAGSRQAKPLFILLKGTPVEVIVSLEGWIKVREQGGGLGWVERSQLGAQRQIIVTAPGADARLTASDAAPVVFSASKDVVLELLEPPANGWVRVRHRDGQIGFVPLKSVWGL